MERWILVDWSERRARIMKRINDSLGERVETAQRKYGDVGGALASGVAAVGSAVADYATPEDATDVGLMVVGGVAGKALSKLRKIKKAERVADSAWKAERASRAAEVGKLAEYGTKNRLGLQQMEQALTRQWKSGKIDTKEYSKKVGKVREALEAVSNTNR